MMRLARSLLLASMVSSGAPAFAQSAPADTPPAATESPAVAPPSLPTVPGHTPPEELKPYAVDTPNEGSETAALVGQFVKTLVALGIVIGIIYFLAKVGVARFIPGVVASRTGKLVRVVERVAVDQKNSLVVVEVGTERLLLSAGERGLKMLAQLGQAEAQGQGEGPSSFKTVLGASRVGTSNDAS